MHQGSEHEYTDTLSKTIFPSTLELEAKEKAHAFLAYAAQDSSQVDIIVQQFRHLGVECITEEQPSSVESNHIVQDIVDSRWLVCVVSDNFLNSYWCSKEFEQAVWRNSAVSKCKALVISLDSNNTPSFIPSTTEFKPSLTSDDFEVILEKLKLCEQSLSHKRCTGHLSLDIQIDNSKNAQIVRHTISTLGGITLDKLRLISILDNKTIKLEFIPADLCKLLRMGCDLQAIDFSHADLSKQDLSKVHLCNANLQQINGHKLCLRGAHLTEVNLTFGNLEEASLQRCNMRGAKLPHANLKQANLEFACLVACDLRQAHLELARLVFTDLADSDLRQANLADATMTSANLPKVQLSEAILERADLQSANLWQARLENVNLSCAVLSGSNLVFSSLRKANLTKANLEGANLEGANLQDAILRGANLKSVNFQNADLQGADLSFSHLAKANLAGANLTGANLTGVLRTEF